MYIIVTPLFSIQSGFIQRCSLHGHVNVGTSIICVPGNTSQNSKVVISIIYLFYVFIYLRTPIYEFIYHTDVLTTRFARCLSMIR